MPNRSHIVAAKPPATTGPRARPPSASLDPLRSRVLELQRAIGNRAVSRLLAGTGKLPVELRDEDEVPATGLFGDFAGWLGGFAGAGAAKAAGKGAAKAAAGAASSAVKPKLTKRTEKGPTAGDCGNFSWTVQWVLDRPSPLGGWVVQRVDVTRDVKDCAGTVSGPEKSGGLNPAWYPLWEAWPISKGQKVTTYAEKNNDKDDDTYSSSTQTGTQGSLKISGSAEFYEGLTLPAAFKVTNKAPTWILPATTTAPALAGGTGTISHDLTATWDCCKDGGKDKTTKLTVV